MSQEDPLKTPWACTTTALLAHPCAPIVLAIFSDVCFVLLDGNLQIIVKQGIPAGQIIFIRLTSTAIICLIWLLFRSPQLLLTVHLPSTRILWLRGSVNSLGLSSMCASLAYITLSEAITILQLQSFGVAWLCWVYLGERFSRVQIVACVLSFCAVVLVIQPEFVFSSSAIHSPSYVLGLLLMVSCTIFGSFDMMLIRMIGDADPVFILFTYAVSGIIVSSLWIWVSGSGIVLEVPVSAWLTIGAITTFGLLAQLTLVMALQRETGGKIAMLGYFKIVFSVIVQSIYTGTIPTLVAFIGMTIITVAGVWSARNGTKDTQDDTIPMSVSPPDIIGCSQVHEYAPLPQNAP